MFISSEKFGPVCLRPASNNTTSYTLSDTLWSSDPPLLLFIADLGSALPVAMEYHFVPVEERAKDEKGNLLPWGYVYKE